MSTLTIYTEKESVRMTYVLDWLLKEQLGVSYVLVSNEADLLNTKFAISYGKQITGVVNIPDSALLWESQKIKADLSLSIGKWEELPTLFADGNNDVPFDIFSALFYILSRYEEYYPYTGDKHDRYPATESVLYKNGWLERPIVDEWVDAFRMLLAKRFPQVEIRTPKFSYHPTYDIDIAWSYQHKGFKRTVGAFAKDILKRNLAQIGDRISVLNEKKVDPYDSYTWLQYLHRKYHLQPTYFMLMAKQLGAFDKNINPNNSYLQKLIKDLSKESVVGIHPSYNANTNCTMAKEEQQFLATVLQNEIHLSRQHYIRNVLPDTYRCLIANNITDDYSMGYGTHLGFRAGTGNTFLWYDLENEEISNLRIHPFCFMDTTAHYDEKLSTKDAFDRLYAMMAKLQKVNAPLTTIFHNFSLGSSKEWKGWRVCYEEFIKRL